MSSSSTPTIFCISHDTIVLLFLKKNLEKIGYRVLIANNVTEARETFTFMAPSLVILDISLPGIENCEISKIFPMAHGFDAIPLIILIASPQEAEKVKASTKRKIYYLQKPIAESSLAEKVEEALRAYFPKREFIKTNRYPVESVQSEISPTLRMDSRQKILLSDFSQFKKKLCEKLNLTGDSADKIMSIPSSELYFTAHSMAIDSEQLAQSMAEFLKLHYIHDIKRESLCSNVFPSTFCKQNQMVVTLDESGENVFVITNPFNWELMDFLNKYVNKKDKLNLAIARPETIEPLLEEHEVEPVKTPSRSFSMNEIEEKLKERYLFSDPQTIEIQGETSEHSEPIILLVNKLIENAYLQGASDIHVEPWEKEVVIRYRIDGQLRVAARLQPQILIRPIIARLKIMGNLNIAEQRLPQDGRIVFKKFTHKSLDFDLRMATAPFNFGEKAVLRILDKQKSIMPLDKLGLSPHNLEIYREKIKSPYGLILHVGPTGSGKSMTLYAALNEINSPNINIQTIEDPIEYTLPGINQLQVRADIGLTFQRALRSYLRQDPNLILVGEIRDRETAEIAIEAALTGHLLLSTLHTNDAASTVTRFIEMGIEPFLISCSLILICAQRLLRRLCPACKKEYHPQQEEKKLLGTGQEDVVIYRPCGCEKCDNSGYKGRIGVHEILVPDDDLRKLINQREITAELLKQTAVQNCGMVTLYWDAVDKIFQGICSLEDTLTRVRRDEGITKATSLFQNTNLKSIHNNHVSLASGDSPKEAAKIDEIACENRVVSEEAAKIGEIDCENRVLSNQTRLVSQNSEQENKNGQTVKIERKGQSVPVPPLAQGSPEHDSSKTVKVPGKGADTHVPVSQKDGGKTVKVVQKGQDTNSPMS